MHSRIFQVSKEPITEYDFVTVEDVLDDGLFVPNIADYVDSLEKLIVEAEWKELLEDGKDLDIWDFVDDGKQKYLIMTEKQIETYRKGRFDIILDECKKVIENKEKIEAEFVERGNTFLLYVLKSALNDECQFRIVEMDKWGVSNVSMERWLCTEVEPNTKYYVGNVLDYHY